MKPPRLALALRHCQPDAAALPDDRQASLLTELPGWRVEQGRLVREFAFADYHRTIAFVNASAWISHTQDHHPDLAISYGRCVVSFITHSAGGLTENDFICAARHDALLA